MELQLVNTLCESRMFRNRAIAGNTNVNDAAELAFMHLMILTIFNKSYDYAPLASEYARRTISYSNFDSFRTNGTDLYIALNRVAGKDQTYENEKDQVAVSRIRISMPRLKRYLVAISKNDTSSSLNRELYRFERDLNIQDSMIKSMRRLVMDWDTLSHSQQSVLVTRIRQYMLQRAKLSDLTNAVVKFQKTEKLSVDDTNDRKKRIWNNPIVKVALAVGGPIAAYKAGKALGRHLGKSSFSQNRKLGRLDTPRSKK